MNKKNQIYVASFLMYVIAGFAGYIYEFSNYWIVLILSILTGLFIGSCILGETKETINQSKFDLISAFAFVGAELILTVCIEIIEISFVGVFRYLNYGVQIVGYLFVMYSIISFILKYTKIYETLKEKINERRAYKSQLTETQKSDLAEKVEETIEQETQNYEDLEDIEIVGENNSEPEVISIECKQEPEIETPYMEEEI